MNSIPDESTCRQLMERYGMLPNIVEHSYRVCQVATYLGKALSRSQEGLDPALIVAAALLHDITKTKSLTTKEDHAHTGASLLRELGCPEVAEVVRGHVHLAAGTELAALREVHIINYADRRVRHNTVVSQDARFVDLVERYGHTPERRLRLKRMKDTALKLEQNIFSRINAAPEDLQALNALSSFDLRTPPPKLTRY
jgi:putative nucleotidyltransferase with HDIG domain